MSDFNPDEYLKVPTSKPSSFDPDAYLKNQNVAVRPDWMNEPGLENVSLTPLNAKDFDKIGDDVATSKFGQKHPIAGAAAGTVAARPLDFIAAATGLADVPELAKLAEGGLARVGSYLENRAATKAAARTMQEVPPMDINLLAPEAPKPPVLNHEPLPPEANIPKVAADTADKFQKTLGGLTDKAKTEYALGEKLLKLKPDEVPLRLPTPEELQQQFQDVVASKKPYLAPSDGAGTPIKVPAASPQERFQKLWNMDKQLSAQIDYTNPKANQGLINLQNQIRAEIDRLPKSVNTGMMNRLRDNYANYKEISGDLGKSLNDPNTQQAVLTKVAKSGLKDVVPVADAGKANAVRQLESKTGQDILNPLQDEFAKEQAYKEAQKRNEQISKAFEKQMKEHNSDLSAHEKVVAGLQKQAADLRTSDLQNAARIAAEKTAKEEMRKKIITGALTGAAGYGGYQLRKLLP